MWQCARVAARVGIAVFALAATGQVAGAEAKKPLPLLGLVLNLDGAAAYGRMALVSVDPGSLRPLPGRTLPLFGYVGGWAFSPDRASLALAGQCQIGLGLSQGIAFVDVARLRPAGCLWLTGNVVAMRWPESRRLVVVSCCNPGEVVTVDPSRRRVLARSSFEGAQLVGTAKAGREIVLLLASGGLGRLGVVDERGAVRSVALEVPVGVQPREATFARPGLAVDPVLRRAFVVPAAGPVAEVALDTLVVAYHELNAPASRVIAAFRPAVRAKELPGTTRTAEWLGNGKLVVSGIGGSACPEQPGGLALLDTGTWSIQTLEGGTDSFAVSEGRIVATGPRAGLAVFDRDGRLLYRRFAGRRSRVEMIHRGRVYVHVGGERDMRALELVSGNDVGRRALPLPRLLLEISG